MKGLTFVLVFLLLALGRSVFSNDPETSMTVLEIIRHNGYKAEEHVVTTNDGYILTLHRINSRENQIFTNDKKPVFFLQHGLLCSSADWIMNPRNGSLGFLLADAGFDVWLGNSRGNTFGKNHTTYPTDSDQFWSFSWDEMASKDIPAVIEYVKKVTDVQQLYYGGHSQGTMIAFAGFSENQKLAKSIKKFYGLAPVSFLGSMKSPLKYLADITPELKILFKIFGIRDFLPQNWLITWLASHFCTKPVIKNVCANIVFVLCGFDKPQMNTSRLDVYMTHTPAGTSVQNLVHYTQAYKTKEFQKYDWGREKNWEKYNEPTPPKYHLSNFTIPSVIYYAGNDWLADTTDVKRLLDSLPKGVVEDLHFIPEWMHLDFIWGLDATKEVYNNVIQDALKDFAEAKVE